MKVPTVATSRVAVETMRRDPSASFHLRRQIDEVVARVAAVLEDVKVS
jgi:hypothetical protein